MMLFAEHVINWPEAATFIALCVVFCFFIWRVTRDD